MTLPCEGNPKPPGCAKFLLFYSVSTDSSTGSAAAIRSGSAATIVENAETAPQAYNEAAGSSPA